MHSSLLVVCAGWLGILRSTVQGHAIAQMEARGHGNFEDPDHDKLGAVASESATCSKVGIDLLKEGGNAADAVRASFDKGPSVNILMAVGLACRHPLLRWGHW